MAYASTRELVERARRAGIVIPAFNIPYLPMIEPVVRALQDERSFGLVMVARLEWEKFESRSLEAIRDEYEKFKLSGHTRLHLDHVPVIDEDNLQVDYVEIIGRAIRAGYESVMVDGSRLPLAENIACTAKIVQLAHAAGVPVEAELGAVMGHEAGPLPPYEELFASGKGFTDPDEARRFVEGTGTDWLSVAIGNIHGAISAATKGQKKVAARLNIEHLAKINRVAGVPLVLHGGTGIRKECILDSIKHGIAKINVATAIRQPYEQALGQGVAAAQDAVYRAMLTVIREDLEIENSVNVLNPEE
ncbi:MAG: class II fructose-bisphosphate aldolase [Verrucomicrobia bacterium]|nr:MAG: class II fructose-bisphosphate aldolase [Verrucomicrobiota bacterium]